MNLFTNLEFRHEDPRVGSAVVPRPRSPVRPSHALERAMRWVGALCCVLRAAVHVQVRFPTREEALAARLVAEARPDATGGFEVPRWRGNLRRLWI